MTDSRFFGVEVGRSVQAYAPLCAEAVIAGRESGLDERSQRFLNVMGRLPSGIDPAQARGRLRAASAGIFEATLPPDSSLEFEREYLSRILDFERAAGGVSGLRDRYQTPLRVLIAVVGLVLLIACANVANLLLTRATTRRHEIAVRLAMGAGRARLVRQFLTESLMLSMIGAVFGLVFARWGSALLVRLISTRTDAVWLDLSLDTRLLAFITAIATATGLLFGIAPTWIAARVTPRSAMTAGGRAAVEGRSGFRLGKPLLIGQVALSLVVVMTAGLLLGTFRTLATLDAGFRAEGVLLVRADMSGMGLDDDQLRLAGRDLLDRLRALPGITEASMSRITPVSGAGWNGTLILDGQAPGASGDAIIWRNAVSEGFFATMGTNLTAGRDFGAGDTRDSPRVAIVNERLARDFLGAGSPVGRRFRLRAGADATPPYEVVGVVQDANTSRCGRTHPPRSICR